MGCRSLAHVALAVTSACLLVGMAIAIGPYEWLAKDNFDIVMEKMISVDEKSCAALSTESLRLPVNTLGQVPQFNVLPQIIIFPNRTNLIHVHNMALNRGYFFSYILQRLNQSEFDFPMLPGFMYYYLSAAATVTSAPGLLNGSSVLFDTNCQYANWFPTILNFNETLPLFGSKAWRLDNYQDNVNWLREPTNNTIIIEDLGAGPDNNYTARWYRLNPMFIFDPEKKIDFIPDRRTDIQGKHQYDFNIFNATSTGVMSKTPNVTRRFYGPPSPGIQENYQPVYFSRPYFDCGRTNMWMVSSVGPVIDYMKRYSTEIKLRNPQYVAISTSDIDFRRIDFDPCGRSADSPDYTYLSGVARCRPSTLCEPIPGYGFQRGGYICHCLPGYRYPFWQNGPFMGRDIEVASTAESNRFDCIPVMWRILRLTQKGISTSGTGVPGSLRRKKRSVAEVKELVYLMQLYNATGLADLRQKVAEHDRLDREAGARAKRGRSGIGRFVQLAKTAVSTAASLLVNVTGGWGNGSSAAAAARIEPRHPLPEATMLRIAEEVEAKKRVKRSVESSSDYGDLKIFYLGRLSSFDPIRYDAVKRLMAQKAAITAETCGSQQPDQLVLPGEVGFGADKQFEVQARTALRLAHFLSGFQQNVNPDEIYGGLHGDKYLNEHQIYGEVFSNVMADQWILSSGVYFDRDAYWNPNSLRKMEYFGPTAYKISSEQRTDQKERQLSFIAEDAAGWQMNRAYYERDWFKVLKDRWASNTYGLETFVTKPYVRYDLNGTSSKPFQRFPIYYRAPRFEDIYWSKPYFDCNPNKDPNRRALSAWVITLAVPFFGISPYKTLQFSGVVTVSVALQKMDINMCPSNFYEANFFKNTAPCQFDTTYCVPIIRNDFVLNNYKCECRQGYEYPFNDINIWFHAGGTVAENYDSMVKGQQNYYRMLTCREGRGVTLAPTTAAVATALLAALLLRRLSSAF